MIEQNYIILNNSIQRFQYCTLAIDIIIVFLTSSALITSLLEEISPVITTLAQSTFHIETIELSSASPEICKFCSLRISSSLRLSIILNFPVSPKIYTSSLMTYSETLNDHSSMYFK